MYTANVRTCEPYLYLHQHITSSVKSNLFSHKRTNEKVKHQLTQHAYDHKYAKVCLCYSVLRYIYYQKPKQSVKNRHKPCHSYHSRKLTGLSIVIAIPQSWPILLLPEVTSVPWTDPLYLRHQTLTKQSCAVKGESIRV